jgi:hypothetical protein
MHSLRTHVTVTALLPIYPPYRNDTFLLTFEACFSVMSGYISVLVYEYASRQCTNRAARARSASTLNMCFQVSLLCGLCDWGVL